MKKNILIGIAGGTGSGKTSVSNAILADFPPSEVALIQQDSYYHDLKHLHLNERATVNFDHPNAVDFDKMGEDLQLLMTDKTVEIPIYDFNTHFKYWFVSWTCIRESFINW